MGSAAWGATPPEERGPKGRAHLPDVPEFCLGPGEVHPVGQRRKSERRRHTHARPRTDGGQRGGGGRTRLASERHVGRKGQSQPRGREREPREDGRKEGGSQVDTCP
uniref:Uncharacterized protein n=1 Tax=Mustela putorius furo TaxID=9669 RepID=M3YLH4_MUSPF